MKRVKRLLCLLLTLCMIVGMFSVGTMAAGLDNFTQANTYEAGQFTDVAADAWYAANVQSAYEFGLMKGNSGTTFNPEGNVTVAETITVAARLHTIYQNGEENFENSDPWYQTYVDYAKENEIIASNFADYNKAATRAEYATILASALPEKALKAMNEVADNAIPDVKTDDACGTAVYTLYRAGILTGSDKKGTFNPGSTIKRSEVAAIVSRMADESLRKSITLKDVKEEQPSAPAEVQVAENPSYFTAFPGKDEAFGPLKLTLTWESDSELDVLLCEANEAYENKLRNLTEQEAQVVKKEKCIEITIHTEKGKTYMVAPFLNVEDADTVDYTELLRSGAKVSVYDDGNAIAAYTVPQWDEGVLWMACQISCTEDGARHFYALNTVF